MFVHVDIMSFEPRLAVGDCWFSIFFRTSSPQPTMPTFGAHLPIILSPHLIDDGCGHALGAWVGYCGFVHAACALRISAATSGSPTNVIDFGIFEPTAFPSNVLTNHRALENALSRWLSCFSFFITYIAKVEKPVVEMNLIYQRPAVGVVIHD